jgi:phosphoglycolate phosphatase-like HAD superfamily hydrolase
MRRPTLSRLSPPERAEHDRQLKDAMEAGMIRPSHNEFDSPVPFVRKADCSLRLCIDYRGFSEATRRNTYPFPRVDDTLDELKDANFTLILTSRLAFGNFRCVMRTSTRQRSKYMTA